MGTVLESEFSLPTRSDMTKKRARSSPEADAVLKKGAWKIILKEASSTSGSAGASQAGLQRLTPPRTPSRKPHRFHQYRRSSDVRPRPIGMAPSPARDAPSRSDHFGFMAITRIVPLLRVTMCVLLLLRRYCKLFLNVGTVCSQSCKQELLSVLHCVVPR